MSDRSPDRRIHRQPVRRCTSSDRPERTAASPALSYPATDTESPRAFRLALGAAVVLHALLFIAPLPRHEATASEPEPRQYRVLPVPRFKPPQPEPEPPPPQPRARRVPVPAPTPNDPELLRPVGLPSEPDLPPGDLLADFPELPPAPEPPDTGPLRIGGPVKAPVRASAPMPVYPEAARQVQFECTVVLETVLDETGRITDIEVVKPCPLGMTEAAVESVERWRYRPATRNGLPVAVYMNLRVDFSLN